MESAWIKWTVGAERRRMILKFKMARIGHKAFSDSLGIINVENFPVWTVFEWGIFWASNATDDYKLLCCKVLDNEWLLICWQLWILLPWVGQNRPMKRRQWIAWSLKKRLLWEIKFVDWILCVDCLAPSAYKTFDCFGYKKRQDVMQFIKIEEKAIFFCKLYYWLVWRCATVIPELIVSIRWPNILDLAWELSGPGI